ncbi:MAG TPA: hypothetical protein VMV60_02025 [Thermoanaerobaculia bacterium]|nr:hypothetical protein [Thermoanaerobaculia bacterium]
MVAYLWLAIIGHEAGENVVRALQRALGPHVLSAGLAASAALVAFWVVLRLRRPLPGDGAGAAAVRRGFAAFVAGFLVLSYALLVAIPTEAVHFLQYALPVFPLFLVTRRLGSVIVALSLAGVVDEGWQYWILHPNWGVSLDFNDILMNVAGASLGVLVVLCTAPVARRAGGPTERLRRADSPILRLLAGIAVAVVAARLAGFLSFEPGDARAGALVLGRSAPDPRFWTMVSWSEKRFHELSPGPGLLLSGALLFALGLLDAFVAVGSGAPGAPLRETRR